MILTNLKYFQELPVGRNNQSGFEPSPNQTQDGNEGGVTPDFHRTRAAIEHTYQKIARTKELIKEGQTARDGL